MAIVGSTEQNTRNDDALDMDCLLIVGPDEIEIQANSLFLSAASKPFRAIFSPEWRHDDDVEDQDGLVKIPLPEDDPSALRLICAVIQHQNHLIPNSLSANTVLSIAVTADKYDCLRALKFASESWFHVSRIPVQDMFILAAAAFLFDSATAFRRITKEMILCHNGSFADVTSEGVEEIMDWRLLGRYPASFFLLNMHC